jgi:hypothetical protein
MNLSDAKVAQLLVPVEDFEKGVACYRDTLGLPFLFAAPPQMAHRRSGRCLGGADRLRGLCPGQAVEHRRARGRRA